MKHRHLGTDEWSLAAIDSALEHGDLRDWRELFACVRSDPAVARRVLAIAGARNAGGAGALAEYLVGRLQPNLPARFVRTEDPPRPSGDRT